MAILLTRNSIHAATPRSFIFGLAPATGGHIRRDWGLLGGENVEHRLQAEHQMLRFVAVEVPEAWHGSLEANDGPGALPELKAVL